MAILVDTSVWVAHFQKHNAHLRALLEQGQALMHPLVFGEVACGTPPKPRSRSLGDLLLLPMSYQATHDEIVDLIEREKLYGSGCGYVDIALLASVLIAPGAKLWTFDKPLGLLATKFEAFYCPAN